MVFGAKRLGYVGETTKVEVKRLGGNVLGAKRLVTITAEVRGFEKIKDGETWATSRQKQSTVNRKYLPQ